MDAECSRYIWLWYLLLEYLLYLTLALRGRDLLRTQIPPPQTFLIPEYLPTYLTFVEYGTVVKSQHY